MRRILQMMLVLGLFLVPDIQNQPPGKGEEWIGEFDERWVWNVPRQSLRVSNSVFDDPEVRTWFRFIYDKNDPNGSRFYCPYCARYAGRLQIPNKPAFMKPYMNEKQCENTKMVKAHATQASHKKCLEMYRKEYGLDGSNTLTTADGVSIEMINMLKVVYMEIKANIPAVNHNFIVTTIRNVGGNIGSSLSHRNNFNDMMEYLSKQFHSRLTDQMRCTPLPISLMIDGSKDRTGRHFLSISMVILQNNMPNVFFYRLIDYTADMKAEGIVSALRRGLDKDDMRTWLKQNLVGVATDGAAVMLSVMNGFVGKLREQVGRKIYSVWCTSHRLQLTVKVLTTDANVGSRYRLVVATLNHIYNFYKSSSLRQKSLRETAATMKRRSFTFSYIHPVRWMDTELEAVNIVCENMDILMTDLRKYRTEPVNQLITTIESPYFILSINLLREILAKFNHYSLKSQTLRQSLIDVLTFRDELNEYLNIDLDSFPLDHPKFKEFVREAKNDGDSCLVCSHPRRCKMDLWFHGDPVIWKTISSPSSDNIRDDFEGFIVASFEILQMSLEKYFPKEQFSELRIFNPLNIPISIETIGTFGVAEIRTIFDNLKPYNEDANHYKFEELLEQWNPFLKFVISHVLFNDIRVSIPSEFWSTFLNQKGVEAWPLVVELVRSVLTIPSGTSEVERSFSIMNNVLDARSSSMSDTHLEDRMRIALNGHNNLDELPFEKFAKEWTGTSSASVNFKVSVPNKVKRRLFTEDEMTE